MKTSHLFLSLVSISLTVISARAASLENNAPIVQLPVYTVSVPRQSAVEQAVARSLDELRATAQTPLAVKIEIPLVDAKNVADHQASIPAPALVVAKS